MGGCDIVDNMNSNYLFKCRAVRWTVKFGDWIITTAATNATNIYVLEVKLYFGDPKIARRDPLKEISNYLLDEEFLYKYYKGKSKNFNSWSVERRETFQAEFENIRQESKDEFLAPSPA